MIEKNIFFIGIVSFFIDFSTAIITPILPIFVIECLDAGYRELGIIIAVSTFVTYITRLVCGYVSDRFGIVKPLVVWGYLISTAAKPLFYIVSSWTGAALLQSLERFGKGVREAPRDSLISHFSKEAGAGKAFGFHRAMDMSGHFIGSLAVFLALFYLGQDESIIRALFLFSALPGFIGVIVVIFFVKDIASNHHFVTKKISFSKEDRALVFPIIVYAGFTAFLFSEAFFVMRAKESGFESFQVPLLFMVFAATQALLSYPVGKLIDRYKNRTVLLLSYIMGIITILLLMDGSAYCIWLSFVGFGTYTVMSLNSIRSLISDKASNKAITYGFFYTLLAFAIFVSSIITGVIWDRFGAEAALLYSLAGAVIMLIVYIIKKND